MSWVAIALLGLAGFFGGGAWSFRREGPRLFFWLLVAASALCVVGAFLWAWDAA